MVSVGGRSKEIPTTGFHIYQPPSSLRGWPNDHDTEPALRHLSLLDFMWLQLLDGIPRHDLIFHLVASYHMQRQCSYCSCAYICGTRVNVNHTSFLNTQASSSNPCRTTKSSLPT